MRLLVGLLAFASLLAAGDLSGRRAPGFSLPDRFLSQRDLADYRGRLVLLDVIRTNCPHCGAFADVLVKLEAKYGDRVVVLTIVNPPDTQATVTKFATDHAMSSPILFDCGQAAVSYFKASPQNPSITVPHIFLIDGEGMIRDDYGYDLDTHTIFEGEGLYPIIDKMLAAKMPGKPKK